MGSGRYYGTIEVGPSWRSAYGCEAHGGYSREQGILEYLHYHSQNMPIFISNMPPHSPADRQPVSITAWAKRLNAHI